MQTTILLVEDDAVLRRGLAELFSREGYRVIEAASVREAKDKLNSEVQAVVLDVRLPDGDGVTLCRAWREAGDQRPILFLTAKDEELDVVRALDSGGNDYVTKPFRMQELLSRVRVLLRSAKPQAVQRDSFSVDESKMQIVKDGEALPLTLTEYKIVKMLMERRGVVPRNLLLEVLWDDGSKFIDDNICRPCSVFSCYLGSYLSSKGKSRFLIYDFETSKNGLWAAKKPDKIGLSAGYIFFVPF